MDWLKTLLFDSGSVAHTVVLYALVISLGVKLGRLKFWGVSLGISFVLFVGILAGHLGLTGNLNTINFVQDFGLILFVYSIGLQVGPSFFTTFRKGGLRLNGLALGMILLNIAVALLLYILMFDKSAPDSFPMLVGVLSGAVTNTPGLGAAEEALRQIGRGGVDIANGYACAYPLAVLGVIFIPMLVKMVCKIKSDHEDNKLTAIEEQENPQKPCSQFIQVTNTNFNGKTILQVRRILNRKFICSRILRGDVVCSPKKDTVIQTGDILYVVSSEDDAEAIRTLLGPVVPVEWEKYDGPEPLVSRRVVITKSALNGKTLGELHLGPVYGVTITRVMRAGTELLATSSLVLQVGDKLVLVGKKNNVAAIAARVGDEVKRLDVPNIATLFLGILLGVVLGSIPLSIPGMAAPLKLGLAGGPLIIAILMGCFGYKFGLVTYMRPSASLMLRELGIALFMASVGIKSGASFVDTILSGSGVVYLLSGLLITIIPVFITALVARVKFHMNYFTILGLVAGGSTNPPALAFANEQTQHDAPAVAYSTVYPLVMFMRILTAQLLVLVGCSFF